MEVTLLDFTVHNVDVAEGRILATGVAVDDEAAGVLDCAALVGAPLPREGAAETVRERTTLVAPVPCLFCCWSHSKL